MRRVRRQRRNRAYAGAAAALVVAGLLGMMAGRGLGAPPHERLARADSAAAVDRLISGEVNRMLLELWKMEGLEAGP